MAVNCAAIVETLLEAELFGIEERTATGVRGRGLSAAPRPPWAFTLNARANARR